jgi:CheY-like chemotaxis protein
MPESPIADVEVKNPEIVATADGSVGLGVLIEEALEIVEPQISYMKVQVEKTIDHSLSIDPVNRELLVLLFVRLIHLGLDALQFRQKDRVCRVSCQKLEGGKVHVQFLDNGRLISSDIASKWLLLTPCEEVLQQKASIGYAATEDRQNSVNFYLGDRPLQRKDEKASAAKNVQQRKLKILIVEDYQELAKHMEVLLTKRGYAVQIAEDGYQGLRSLRDGKYDIVVLDLNMPIVDGGLLIQTLSMEMPQVIEQLIVVSGFVEEHQAFLKERNIPFLRKPFTQETLYQAVDDKLASMEAKSTP